MYTLQAQVALGPGPEDVTEVEIQSRGRSRARFQPAFVDGLTVNVPEDHFSWDRRVRDEIALTLQQRVGLPIPLTPVDDDLPPLNCVVVVLESPHRDEYVLEPGLFAPIGPLRNANSRQRFNQRFGDLLADFGPLPDGTQVVLSNPVPYQASMDRFMEPGCGLQEPIRNAVWKKLFEVGFRADFMRRLHRYRPAVVVNACTYDLRSLVGCAIYETRGHAGSSEFRMFECTHHPCAWHVEPDLVEVPFVAP